jgi:hypothetical protein
VIAWLTVSAVAGVPWPGCDAGGAPEAGGAPDAGGGGLDEVGIARSYSPLALCVVALTPIAPSFVPGTPPVPGAPTLPGVMCVVASVAGGVP